MIDLDLKLLFDAYLKVFPEDRANLSLLAEQLGAKEDLQTRSNFRGHMTAAGIVLSADRRKVLLIHHIALGTWLQPGGHWEKGDDTPLAGALREVREETGAKISAYWPVDLEASLIPVQIETHYIPVSYSKGEPAHFHHDFRYVFQVGAMHLARQIEEVSDVAWLPLDAPQASALSLALARWKRLCRKRMAIG